MRARWLILAPGLMALGWRGDGTGHLPDASPPASLSAPSWSTPLPARGSGSPIVVEGVVAVTAEPTALIAVDAATGRLRWRKDHPVVDVLPTDLRSTIEPFLARVAGADARLATLNGQYSELMRQVRAGRADVADALTQASADIAALKAEVELARPYLTRPTSDMIGYSAPTPATDGQAIYALFGNGVVASYQPDGARRWAVWLGADDDRRRGYQGTCGASPLIAGDLLIVPFRELVALSLRDGRVVWRGPKWPHYGAPTLARVDGRDVLLTPDGVALDPRTGRALLTGLGDLVYTSPAAHGGRAWYVGNNVGFDRLSPNHATGWSFAWSGDALVPTRLWDQDIAPQDRVYGAPTLVGERLFTFTKRRTLLVLDAATGTILADRPINDAVGEEIWGPPLAVSGRLFVATTGGHLWEFATEPPFNLLHAFDVEVGYASPWFVGGAVFVRGERTLSRYDR